MSVSKQITSSQNATPITKFFVALFVFGLLLPLGSRLILDDPEPYGRKAFTEIRAPLQQLLSGNSIFYKNMTDANFERSNFVKAAISIKHKVFYKLFGYVDTPDVISGKDGWLFVKSQFQEGKCYNEDDLNALGNAIQTTISMGRTVEVPITVSMSADKSTLYPDKFHPRASWLTNCAIQNSRTLRETMNVRVPDFIDHTRALMPHLNRENLYYKTGTHWTHIGAYFGVRHLVAAITGQPEINFPQPAIRPGSELTKKDPDLATILLIGATEPWWRLDNTTIRELRKALEARKEHFIFIHDSFYGTLQVPKIFKKSTALRGDANTNNKRFETLLRAPGRKHVIVNVIERNLIEKYFLYFVSEPRGLKVLQEQNAALAHSQCKFSKLGGLQMVERLSKQSNMEAGDTYGYYQAINSDPRFILSFDSPARKSCLKFKINSKKRDTLKIFLPPFHGTQVNNNWEPGRVLTYPLVPGDNAIALMLPRNIRGRQLRIDPIATKGEFNISDLEIGTQK